MQLISKFNKGIRFFLCAFDIFSKWAWVIPLKDKNYITITNASQNTLDKPNRKPNKIFVDKGSEFYNRSMKSWLQDNHVEMYSIKNKRKSVLAERFIRNKIYKIYKYMSSMLKNVSIDKLDDIVIKDNNTYHRTIKMKTADI